MSPDQGLAWDEVARRFGEAPTWWVATTGPNGPHSVPVWGVICAARLHFYGHPTAVRSRNLAVDPRLVLHLDSGRSVLILNGTARPVGAAADDPAVTAAYHAKYTHPTDAEFMPDAPHCATSLMYAVTPDRAIAWDLYSGDTTSRHWRGIANLPSTDPHD